MDKERVEEIYSDDTNAGGAEMFFLFLFAAHAEEICRGSGRGLSVVF